MSVFATADLVARIGPIAEALPTEVIEHASALLLNGLATAIGARDAPGVAAVVEIATRHGGRPTSPIPGRPELLDPLYAATATATASHAYDFDDTHLETVLHPTAVSMATGLALAVARGLTGARFLQAFVLGCEVQLRVGAAMPGHYERGWHITGTCGVLGAAVTAGLCCGLDERALAHCVGTAASETVGHRAAFGTDVKTLHAGKAAANGLLAALLAERGFTAPGRPLEGPRGFFTVMAQGPFDAPRIMRGVGARWELLATTVKPYPCGVVEHPAIEAAENLSRDGLDAARVRRIEIRCHPLVPELTGVPAPKTALQARFSTAHAVAVALLTGSVGQDTYTAERVRDPDVVRLRDAVTLLPDGRCAREEGAVTVHLDDGRTRTEHVSACRGSVARQLSSAELNAKVAALVEPVLPGRTQDLIDEVGVLWTAPDLTRLASIVRAA